MNKLQKVLLIPGSLVLVASLGMACGDDDDDIDGFATATSPAMTDATPTIDGGTGTTPTVNGDDDIVARVNDLGAEIAMASDETRNAVQDLWNEAQVKLSELATATADERAEIEEELEDLVTRIEERLDSDS